MGGIDGNYGGIGADPICIEIGRLDTGGEVASGIFDGIPRL